jgi:hypothetical protein
MPGRNAVHDIVDLDGRKTQYAVGLSHGHGSSISSGFKALKTAGTQSDQATNQGARADFLL